MGGHQHLPLLPSLSNVSKAEKACLHLRVLFWGVGNKTRGTTECAAVLSLVKKLGGVGSSSAVLFSREGRSCIPVKANRLILPLAGGQLCDSAGSS